VQFLTCVELALLLQLLKFDCPLEMDRLVRSVREEEMGRDHGVFARLRRKALFYHLTISAVLVLASIISFWVFVPQETQQKVYVESSPVPAVFPPSFPSLMLSAPRPYPQTNDRLIYPYSVIPGGIRSVEELKSAISHDPLLKAHYRGFNLDRARLIRLTQDREVHVSYRLGNRIYWTKRKLALFKNETLITDGKNTSRTRCGNRISDPPATPISREEPVPEVLDTPLGSPPSSPLFPPDNSPVAPPPIILTPDSPPVGPIFIPPIIVPVFPGSGAPQPAGPKPPMLNPLPEPGTFWLLIATLPAAWLVRKRHSKETTQDR